MISIVILTHNEEHNLPRLLSECAFSDDIILVDDGSTDSTLSIARKHDCHVIQGTYESFAQRRNDGMKHAKNNWILFIDADEHISPRLRKEILSVCMHDSPTCAFYIPRIDTFWGKDVRYGEVLKSRTQGIIRLVQSDSGKWVGKVHETFLPNGKTGMLKNHIKHTAHAGISDFLTSVNTFSTIRAREMYDQGTRLWGLQILTVPLAKFVYTFFILGGFIDGAQGFVYSFMMSFHSFLVRSKVYLLQNS